MRGNLLERYASRIAVGSIPAYAGEPRRYPAAGRRVAVYPRVCGGTRCRLRQAHPVGGLSPRMRGNRWGQKGGHIRIGSIPAYAGEPRTLPPKSGRMPVYPRVCGGTPRCRRETAALRGLSPRMRGNPLPGRQPTADRGSIPAYAGEPPAQGCPGRPRRVYPRVCGGTRFCGIIPLLAEGLSPRMRGNPRTLGTGSWRARSIPAYAGEPGKRPAGGSRYKVYPRVCGGTHPVSHPRSKQDGLSPRMRGNPGLFLAGGARRGSIPAYAGEPGEERGGAVHGGVYPRVCGGTLFRPPTLHLNKGLSPRMRGNRCAHARCRRRMGSIPAYAGEPSPAISSSGVIRVYPRVCGGT